MRRDMEQKLQNLLNGMDKGKINSGKQTAEKFLSTPEGKKLLNGLGNIDKNKLSEAFMKMDSSEMKKKLQNADFSKLSGLKAEDILKKLR